MSQSLQKKVDTCLPIQFYWLLWKFIGLQPPQHKSKWFKVYIAYAFILIVTILLFLPSQIINLILSKNISELFENICNTTSVGVCIFKFFNILMVRHKLSKVSKILKRLDARAQTCQEVAILEEGIASARKLFVTFFILCCCFIVSCQMIVCFASERMLVFPSWFPWDWKASKRNYLFAHWYEMYAISLHGMIDLTCDTYPPTCLIILSAHIKALALRIKDLGVENISCEETLYKELAECIKDHDNTHKLYQNIQEIISIGSFAQFIATGMAQCTLGAYMIYVGFNPWKLLYIFLYFVAITMEIFLLCYYGDLYCQANEHLTVSIYACNWMDRDIKFQKAFLFLLQRSQMPSIIKAGNLIPVQMPAFVKILKTAYSVFTILNNAK